MSNNKKTTRPLTPEEQEAYAKERRNQEAFGQRAKIALSLIPTLISTYPEKDNNEILFRATSLAESFMDRLLGVRFEPTKTE